jgi:hypothetical protein
MKMKPNATWTNDCQGKKDYDGQIISVNTRYWPGSNDGGTLVVIRNNDTITTKIVPYGEKPSAKSSIVLRFNEDDYLTWRKMEFTGDTEEIVKSKVETWVEEQIKDIIESLGGIEAFHED